VQNLKYIGKVLFNPKKMGTYQADNSINFLHLKNNGFEEIKKEFHFIDFKEIGYVKYNKIFKIPLQQSHLPCIFITDLVINGLFY
jgi:Ca2+-binding EF-hand superfamily protein